MIDTLLLNKEEDFWDTIKDKIYESWAQGEGEKVQSKGIENILNEVIITDNFSKFKKQMAIQV
jgi:hypothetical protein